MADSLVLSGNKKHRLLTDFHTQINTHSVNNMVIMPCGTYSEGQLHDPSCLLHFGQ